MGLGDRGATWQRNQNLVFGGETKWVHSNQAQAETCGISAGFHPAVQMDFSKMDFSTYPSARQKKCCKMPITATGEVVDICHYWKQNEKIPSAASEE